MTPSPSATSETTSPDTSLGLGLLKARIAAAYGPITVASLAMVGQGLVTVAIAWLLSGILAHGIFGGRSTVALMPDLFWIISLVVLRAGLSYGAEIVGFAASARVRRALFADVLDKLAQLGPVKLAGFATGDVVVSLTEAVASLDGYWRRWFPTLALASALPLVIFLVMLPVDWISATVLLVASLLAPVFMFVAGHTAQQASNRQWQVLTRLNGHLLDAIQGLVDLKIFSAARAEIARVRAVARAYRRETMRVLRLAFLSALALEFLATITVAVIAVAIGFRLMWGTMDYRSGLFLLLLAPEFFVPLRVLAQERHARMDALAAATRIADLLALPVTLGGCAPPPCAFPPKLRFEGVAVEYDSGRRVLDGFSLDISAGEHVALVGASGAGKSTVLALLLGFITPAAGRVLVNNADLSTLDLTLWRQQIAHVPQRPQFFSGTLGEAVAMGRAHSLPTHDRANRVTAALEEAQLATVVKHLPQGVNTALGDRADGLSGGEGQRLAIARAIFGGGALVLCDEPTAHLDSATETAVNEALAALRRGRTAVTIAHRLETVKCADRIVVLDHGRVVEEGSHQALLANKGAYSRLWARVQGEGNHYD